MKMTQPIEILFVDVDIDNINYENMDDHAQVLNEPQRWPFMVSMQLNRRLQCKQKWIL